MHKGVWHGENAEKQPKRILILGESHHTNSTDNQEVGKSATYTTHEKIQQYIDQYNDSITQRDNCYQFFEKIVLSFGEAVTDRAKFWNKVYFGNYIPVLCGVGDDKAENLIKGKDESSGESNRSRYNDALFEFVNAHEIDGIFCFSRRTYNALPSYHDNSEKRENAWDGETGGKRDYISHCVYRKDVTHNHTDKTKILNKELHVYGLRHPSGKCGFEPSNYSSHLAALLSSYTQED